jgi:hypothetical protein
MDLLWDNSHRYYRVVSGSWTKVGLYVYVECQKKSSKRRKWWSGGIRRHSKHTWLQCHFTYLSPIHSYMLDRGSPQIYWLYDDPNYIWARIGEYIHTYIQTYIHTYTHIPLGRMRCLIFLNVSCCTTFAFTISTTTAALPGNQVMALHPAKVRDRSWMDGWMDGCVYVCMYVCIDETAFNRVARLWSTLLDQDGNRLTNEHGHVIRCE